MSLPYSRDFMLSRMFAADAAFDGLFYTGVTSTGIYCLPSCRARKPQAQNVAFHATTAQARAAGLRACRRCQPDAFQAGVPVEEAQLMVALAGVCVAEVPTVRALGQQLQVGRSALHRLFRDHLHTSPGEWLARQRVQAAADALLRAPESSAAEVAFAVGYGSLSAFGAQFRRVMGVSPQVFRQGAGRGGWTVRLPVGFPVPALLRDLARDPLSLTQQVRGHEVTAGWRLPSGPRRVTLTFGSGTVTVQVASALTAPDALALHHLTMRALGLTGEALAAPLNPSPVQPERAPPFGRGLRVPLVPDLFDGLIWAVAGQQVTFACACALRRRLVARCGAALGDGLFAPPAPEDVARLSVNDLRALGLTGARAAALSRLAGQVACGELDLPGLAAGPVGAARRRLLAVPGVGPWTAEYVLLRVLGFADIVPAGDAALAAALQRYFALPARPDAAQVSELLAPFAPQRSLATFQFWHHVHPRGAPHDH
ncbi:helix-turn-helix domain-containing protein [Deinococcus sp. HMF7620]|uniref:DNA-3-methyladenine glycosylase II n=1 Tax=Deinococcus arboris TaxID=2682977 RepID=A0A7C9LS13_9DEIO|nr:Ada metal-binding domain-containing protein [Deinococcus arboris]MVN85780.1 helix-turn-helix domain-containing protein [Deinococcus arboris]